MYFILEKSIYKKNKLIKNFNFIYLKINKKLV